MEASAPYSKSKDPFRIKDRIYISLSFPDSGLQWRKGQPVHFSCHHDGQKPSNDIKVFLADVPHPVATITHELLARYLHTGTDIKAEIISKPRGTLFGGKLGNGGKLLHRKSTEPQTLRICVEPGELDWHQINPIIQRNNDIALKVEEAGFIALTDQAKALSMFEDAVNDIYDLHFESPLAHYWRRVQFPVNELSAILENMGAFEAALDTIEAYEAFDDQLGLLPIDQMEVRTRKARLTQTLLQTGYRESGQVMTPRPKEPAAVVISPQLKQRIAG